MRYSFNKVITKLLMVSGFCSALSMVAFAQTIEYAFKAKPYGFIENKGQIINQNGDLRNEIKFVFPIPGFHVELRRNGWSYDTYIDKKNKNNLSDDVKSSNSTRNYHRLDIDLVDSNPKTKILSEEPYPDYLNYYTTGLAEQGVTFVRHYKKIIYKNIYNKIDLEFKTIDVGDGQLDIEYDFIIFPGGNINDIKLRYHGYNDLEITEDGVLLSLDHVKIKEHIPHSYFLFSDNPLVANYFSKNKNTIGIAIQNNKPFNEPMVIDPVPIRLWGTYIGGTEIDWFSDLDGQNQIAAGGITESATNIATSGTYRTSIMGPRNGFLMEFNSSGNRLWGTYFGDGYEDDISIKYNPISTAGTGNYFVTGDALGNSIATGGTHKAAAEGEDAFLVNFYSDGTRAWGTYFGGTGSEDGYAVTALSNTPIECYIVGRTTSTTGISTTGAYQETINGTEDGFIAKFNGTGSLVWSSYFGGEAGLYKSDPIVSVATNNISGSGGIVLVGGYTSSTTGVASIGAFQTQLNGNGSSGTVDGYLAKFTSTGVLEWSTYVGGENGDLISSIDYSSGFIYAAGWTASINGVSTMNSKNVNSDMFITKFDLNGSRIWGRYVGGSKADGIGLEGYENIRVSGNRIYLAGNTESLDFPVSQNTYQPNYGGGSYDGIVAKYDTDGMLIWSSYLGSTGDDNVHGLTVTSSGPLVTGFTNSTTGLTTSGVHQETYGGGLYEVFATQFDNTDLSFEPTSQPSNIQFSNVGSTMATVSYSAASIIPNGYLVLRKPGTSITDQPIDGISYSLGSTIGSSKVVYVGVDLSFDDLTVSPNTQYTYKVFSYNSEESGLTKNYLISGAPNNTITTLAAQPISQPSNLIFSIVNQSSLQLDFNAAGGSPSGYLIVRKEGSSPTGIPIDGTSYTIGTFLGDGEIVSLNNSTTFIDLGLIPGGLYYYTIFSYNGSGQSSNYLSLLSSNTAMQQLLPATPSAADAINITANSFKAKWELSNGAEAYEIDVSLESTFNASITGYPKNVGDILEETVSGLTSSTIYYYRVKASNQTGSSPYSNITSVTTINPPGVESIAIGTIIFNDVVSNETSVPISVEIIGGGASRSVTLFHRGISSTDQYAQVVMSNSTANIFEVDIPLTAFDELGLEFYINAQDGSDSDQSQLKFIYQSFSEESSIVIPSIIRAGGTQKSYQIISIPHDLGNSNNIADIFEPILGQYEKSKWRLVRYQNGKNTDYKEGISKIELGKSYWFNSLEPASIKPPKGTSPKFNQSSSFQLVLSQGWNQIATPFPFVIDWDDVLSSNGSPQGVGNYKVFNADELGFAESNSLVPYEGGFVFTDIPITLNISVLLKNSAGGRRSSKNLGGDLSGDSWFLPITLSQGVSVNRLGGFGMHPEASNSKDKFDEHSLPRFLNYLELNVYHNEYFIPKFTSDVVPTSSDHTWDFVVESNFEAPVTEIQWDNLSLGSNPAQLLLVDEAANVIVDMKTNSYYRFPSSSRREFKVLFAVDEQHLKPQLTSVGRPFPNPFTSEVTLPILSRGDGHLQISVYDMIGKQVKLLVDDVLPPGLHEARWDGTDEQGSRVASGVYIYNLRLAGKPLQYGRLVIK